jgi:hypothetical protein
VIDSAPPYDVVTLLLQKDLPAREFDTEAPTDENKESCALLTFHPLRAFIATAVDTPLDLHGLAVTRIVDVLEVPQEPTPVQYRILAPRGP